MTRTLTHPPPSSLALTRAVIDSLPTHIALLDSTGHILATNLSWSNSPSSLIGHPPGTNYLDILSSFPNPQSEIRNPIPLESLLDSTQSCFSLDYPCPSTHRWFSLRLSRIDGPLIVVSHEDITQRHLAEQRLQHESHHDPLTGLPNRSLFHDRIQNCLARSKRRDNYKFSILFLNLDRFKVINESLGHAAGDKLLVTLSNRLQNCLREGDTATLLSPSSPTQSHPLSHPHPPPRHAAAQLPDLLTLPPKTITPPPNPDDLLARLGGDEFTVLLDDVRDYTDAVRVAQRIQQSFALPLDFDGHDISSTVSIGIVNASEHYDSPKDLLRDAAAAMSRAKAAGKNRYAVFNPALHASAVTRLRLESDLRKSLERNQLSLAYQPLVSLADRHLIGFEALVRWTHPTRGPVPPSEFISVAEDMGLIVPIGQWIITQACQQLAAWHTLYPHLPSLSVAVNLSRKQLADADLVVHLKRTLAETQINPASLKLEITESSIMEDVHAAQQVLSQIRSLGLSLHMDDFGTGYSSLSCLHQFPLDGLKIDRSFILNGTGRRDYAAVIQAIVALAHNLNMRVVAEGLESLEQVALLQALDCDFGQGYFFSPPLSPLSATRFIHSHTPLALSA